MGVLIDASVLIDFERVESISKGVCGAGRARAFFFR
jgi:hypothetical protein